MTEAQWLACKEPDRMLWFLLGQPATGWQRFIGWLDGRREPAEPARVPGVSDRKLRLYAAACCRLVWDLLRDGRSRYAVEVGERYADGAAGDEELTAAHQTAWDAVAALSPTALQEYFSGVGAVRGAEELWYWAARAASAAAAPDAAVAAQEADAAVTRTGVEWATALVGQAKRIAGAIGFQVRAHLLRDVFGNPFRATVCQPPWRTPAVVDLAQTIYDQRALGRLPELGKILQDVGCAEPELLHHCRSARPHALGCWVVDQILGKE